MYVSNLCYVTYCCFYVMNRYILEARELPVLSMLERVKSQLMSRHYTKQKEASTWPGPICPKIKKKLDRNIELSNNVYADGAGDGLFAVGELVSSQPVEYVVDLKQKTCSCCRWQKTGIPCPHVISCLRHEDIDPITLVDKCYSLEMHNKAYVNIVYPCKDRTEWQRMNGPTIFPPLFTKHVGRPTKIRRKAPGEVDARGGGKKMSRHGVIMHCKYCGLPDHNIAGCKFLKAGVPPPNAPPASVPPPETPQVNVPPPETPQVSVPPPNAAQDLLVNTLIQQVYFYSLELFTVVLVNCTLINYSLNVPPLNALIHYNYRGQCRGTWKQGLFQIHLSSHLHNPC